MPVTLTSTGKVFHEDFVSGDISAFFTKINSPSFSGGEMITDGLAIGVVTASPLTLPTGGGKLTLRSKAQVVHTGGDEYVQLGGHIEDKATQPTAPADYMQGKGTWLAGVQHPYHWGIYAGSFIYNNLQPTVATYYIYEQEFQDTSKVLVFTYYNSSTMALIGTASKTGYAFTNSAWLMFGTLSGTGHLKYDYLQGFTGGANITVTGLSNLYHVDVTDAADVVKADATSAGASVVVAVPTLEFPFNGKVKVYQTDGGALLGTFTGADIWGGDSYAYASASTLQGVRIISAKHIYEKLGATGTTKWVVQNSSDAEVYSVDNTGKQLMKAATAPSTPSADTGVLYEYSTGATPTKEVGIKFVNEAGITVIIASQFV